MGMVCEIINTQVSALLEGKDLLALKKNDDLLKVFKARKAENDNLTIGKNVLSAVSQALYFAYGKAVNY